MFLYMLVERKISVEDNAQPTIRTNLSKYKFAYTAKRRVEGSKKKEEDSDEQTKG